MDPREYKAKQVANFLKKMRTIESSDGANTDHPVMKTGMHKGTHAVGDYGIMPLTAIDLDRQFGSNELQDGDKFDAQEELQQNPELAERLAQSMASKLLNKYPEEESAYKWESGSAAETSPEILAKSDRIRKFKVLNKEK
jgi:hypothetical protein